MAASGLTWLQIINRVLERLREGSVSTYNETTYSTFLSSLANQVKSEIESAYPWNALRDTFSVTAVNGTTNYVLTNSGANATIIDGWNTTVPQKLTRGTNADFNAKFFGTTTVAAGPVEQYLPAGVDDTFDLRIDVWPNPSSTNTIKFNVMVPQADIAAGATVPLCPQDVLIEETIARARVERGDEDAPRPQPGETFILKDILQSAISREAGHDGNELLDWQVE
jgi:hypothetical protein